MLESLFNALINQLNGAIFAVFFILGVCFWATAKITLILERFSHSGNRLEKVEAMSDRLITIETKVNMIYQNTNPTGMARRRSPIALTEIGEETMKSLGAQDIFRDYAVRLIAIVEGKNPKNPYDIQQIAFEVAKKDLLAMMNEKEIDKIKTEAYNRGALVEDITEIFGILLRDKILKDKGFFLTDVDRHSPTS